MTSNKNICVLIQNEELPYSETFIKAHVEYLPAKILSFFALPSKVKNEIVPGSVKSGLYESIQFVVHKIRNVIKYYKVKRFVAQNNIEYFLAEYGMTGVRALPICKRIHIPLVVHFHGYDAYRKDVLERYSADYKELFEVAKAIVVVSKDMEQQVVKLGAPIGKVYRNVYGVDLNKFQRAQVKASPRQLIAVGRLVEKKAPYLTILAFQKVISQVPDAKLIMVGDGELYEVCSKMIKALNLQENIVLNKALPHDEVALLMRSSRAFVQHSLIPLSGDSEGTPNTILEAQASGLPVVSTNHAGIIDVVLHGVTGFLVEEGDIETMAVYMIELLLNPELAFLLGEEGYKNVKNNYSIEKSISDLRNIIEN